MGYAWSASIIVGAEITRATITEARTHGDTFAALSLGMNPAPAACGTYNKWESTIGASAGDSKISNLVFDELQYNLNYWRTQNYCRGYQNAPCISYCGTQHSTVNSAYYTPNCAHNATVA